jgi:methyltransferase-like protein/ubiquinone/menaquinone biosynthesis C-methylase UbiE
MEVEDTHATLVNRDYNLLPYPSMPFAYTQPSRLAALSALFGIEAPSATEASVLELGCASGGNIIPLAARFPNARFVGMDLSERHISQGRQRIAALGIENIELRQGDLAAAKFHRQKFDYVICHGVFSWVPKSVQDAIFRTCDEVLTENGMATISYNVLPGWHLRNIVRDICIYHVGRAGPPRERVAKARGVLESIAQSTNQTEPYGVLLRSEAKRIARRPSAYILGEFLVADNVPCYFSEFVQRAELSGLNFLCEGDLNSSIPEIRDPKIRRLNKALAGSDPVDLEQYIDFFVGRTFRRSVLIRAKQARHVKRDRSVERLRPLHFAGCVHEKFFGYTDEKSRPAKATHSAVRVALQRLGKAYPATLTLEQLTDNVERENFTRICGTLFALVVAGQVTVSTVPTTVGRADAERPKMWSLARIEAEAKQPWLTSLNHVPIPLEVAPRELLMLLDGSNDRGRLIALMSRRPKNGLVPAVGADANNEAIGKPAAQYIDQALSRLAFHALLENSTTLRSGR